MKWSAQNKLLSSSLIVIGSSPWFTRLSHQRTVVAAKACYSCFHLLPSSRSLPGMLLCLHMIQSLNLHRKSSLAVGFPWNQIHSLYYMHNTDGGRTSFRLPLPRRGDSLSAYYKCTSSVNAGFSRPPQWTRSSKRVGSLCFRTCVSHL
jgi:hypothetical protein